MTEPDERDGHQARAAINAEHDLAILLSAAVQVGCTDALTAGRPTSREAELVQQLTKGTACWGNEPLADYKGPVP